MNYQHIYLSPHYDDAALSCGGSICKQTRQQEAAAVITVFAGAPDLSNAALSKLAQAAHHEFSFLCPDPSAQEVVRVRRAENEQAMQHLGAASICLEQFHDCIYRGIPAQKRFLYRSATAILGKVHPADAAITEEIGQAVSRLTDSFAADAVFYAPLAIGNHVDHRLVHQVGLALQEGGQQVCFYEDYPYADKEEYLRIPCRLLLNRSGCRRLQFLEPLLLLLFAWLIDRGWLTGRPYQSAEEIGKEEGLQAETIVLAEEDIEAKIRSVAAYASQVPMLFETEAKMKEQLVQCCQEFSGERVWRRAA